MSNLCASYIIISLLIIVNIALLAVKQNVASIFVSVVTALLVVFTLIPHESIEDGTWVYSQSGAARFVPKRKISPRKRAPGTKVKEQGKQKEEKSARCNPLRYNTQLMPSTLGASTPPGVMTPVDITPRSNLPPCNAPSDLPTDKEMRDYIRNNGMYGIHGNLSCRKMQRMSVADKGFLQPLNARNQLLQFLAADQLHAKDSYLIPREKPVIS